MQYNLYSALVALSCLLYSVHAAPPQTPNKPKEITWNCKNTPESCNNACYWSFCFMQYNNNAGLLLTHAPPEINDENRLRSGFKENIFRGNGPDDDHFGLWKQGLPKDGKSVAFPGQDLTTPDEWPPASAKEGGGNAILRATSLGDSQNQGPIISSWWANVPVGGQIIVKFDHSNTDFRQGYSPYCACDPSLKGVKGVPPCSCRNDKYEWKKIDKDTRGKGPKGATFELANVPDC